MGNCRYGKRRPRKVSPTPIPAFQFLGGMMEDVSTAQDKKAPSVLNWKVYSYADLVAHNETEEGKAQARSEEAAFRRGFYDGVDTVLDAIAKGVTPRQLSVWFSSAVFDWRFSGGQADRFWTPERVLPEPWANIRKRILERDGRVCQYCGATEVNAVDHIVPVSNLGPDTDNNLVACCTTCNLRKLAHSIHEFLGHDEANEWLTKNAQRRLCEKGV